MRMSNFTFLKIILVGYVSKCTNEFKHVRVEATTSDRVCLVRTFFFAKRILIQAELNETPTLTYRRPGRTSK